MRAGNSIAELWYIDVREVWKYRNMPVCRVFARRTSICDKRNYTRCDETHRVSSLRACHADDGSLAICDILWCIDAPLQSANFRRTTHFPLRSTKNHGEEGRAFQNGARLAGAAR
jgi:hypothetical protein